ncbi:hypothetical protein NGB36_16740 [Streptomyces sp. RB6PN25]|uniref:Ribbon-helix-helix protein CopG domain-containing protein n=1 Tax=Streptomyces humicola TaxID=2953240 RepID=A0ABT1PYU0_9ACTN|nr:hypothetical protein [Streptomyces humicola]MCQ4082210.1 hypothetical protein [Streptomyces humicola]
MPDPDVDPDLDVEKSPAELLLQAVDTLPKAERDRVLVWLIDPTPNSGQAAWAQRSYAQGIASRVPELSPQMGEALRRRFSAARGDELQAVPVRLTADQLATLRQWSQEHQFSMATVIRGLVGRFLEEQGAAAPSEASEPL